jgi:hypothetical protein
MSFTQRPTKGEDELRSGTEWRVVRSVSLANGPTSRYNTQQRDITLRLLTFIATVRRANGLRPAWKAGG